MKFLRIFGLFALILGFAFNGAFAATSSTTGFGTPDDQMCDETGCYYCDDTGCYVCDTHQQQCRMFCPNGQYGQPGGDCAECRSASQGHAFSLQPTNRTANYCFKECGSTACTQIQDATWNSYFGGSNQADNFAIDLFVHDPKAPRLASFYPLESQNCNLETNYCAYTVSCKTTTNACKPGHIQVNFYDNNGTTLVKTRYIVNRVAWSTQNTQFGDASTTGFYSDIIYPIFDAPTAPAIEGKRFIGWYDAQTDGNKIIDTDGKLTYANAQTVATLSGTIKSLYARYEDIITAIQLSPNGGTPTTTYTIYYKNGTYYCDAAATATPITSSQNIFTRCNFTKPNYGTSTFNGYYSATSGGTQYTDADGKLLSAAYNSISFGEVAGAPWYAQYESTCDTTILLEANGGSFIGTCPSEFYPTQSGGQWLSPTLNSGCLPTRPGYTFMGYVWTDGGSGMYYDANLNPINTIWPLCNQDKVILEAQWEGNCNLITFDDNNVTETNVNANNTQRKRSGATDWLDADPTNANACGKPMTTNPTVTIPTNLNAVFQGYWTMRDSGGHQVFGANGAATSYGNTQWTISTNTILYARWVCNSGYTWNTATHACEQNTASVTYKCYVGDSGQIDDGVTLTNYAVRSLSWYSACNINNNNPVPGYKWRFSGTNTDYNAGDIIPSWTYGNDKTFTPAYTATFNCNNDYWQTPTGGSAPAAQSVLLGDTLTMPNMPCEVKPEYDGWLETNYTWKTSYTQNLTSPVPGAQCQISDLHYGSGDNFPWNCPTDLTFEPLTKFINKPITVSCGLGGTSQTFIMTFENQNEIEQDIIDFFNSCGGSCPLDNPSGPHGYNRKVVCATGLENQNLPTTWEQIDNDTQGRTCYKTPAGTNVQSILNEISLAQITDLNIYGISYCPQRVTYKCSEDATDVYNDAPYAVFEREYTTQTPGTIGCESGLAFSNWKNLSDNQTFDADATIDEWPYEDPVTLVAQWGGANTYQITYVTNGGTNASTGVPTTYTYGTGATIDGVPTREHSTFAGWCTESTLTNCAPTQTISPTDTGNRTFWAKWDCVEPYHSNFAGDACEACADGYYYDPNNVPTFCSACPSSFPFSKSPFTWSEKQCYRDCPDASVCRDDENLGNAFPASCQFQTFSNNNKQVDFKGNYDAGVNSCGDVAYCPYGIIGCGISEAFKPMTAPVEFHGKIPEQSLGTRYIFGKRAGSNSIDLATGNVWSQIVGPAQQTDVMYNIVGGQPAQYKYTYIFYPTYAAPNADMPGYTFNGYYYPRSGGTRYVESDYLLGATNAQSVLSGQVGDSNTARHLYATLENGGYTQNEYAITYNCGTGTGTSQTDTATYGENYTVKNNTGYTNCEKPGYSFLGWVFSGDNNMYNEGYVFRPWNYTNNATFTAKWNDTGNTYTITYKPNYDGATEPDVTQSVTYGATFTTKPAGTFHRPGYEMTAWVSGPNQPNTPYPELAHTYTYLTASNVNLFVQWEMCTAGTYSGATQCTDCPDEYPLSVAGASAIEQCYKNCSVPCTPVACPANSTCTQTNTMYNGTQYYGGACNAVPQNCEITEIICDAGFFLNGTVCEPCPNGTTSPAGSTNVNQCSACPDGQYVDNETCTDCPDGFDHSDANATSQSQCYHDCETPCTEPECPANSTSCTYGTNPNSGAWYFGTDACNATPLVCPIESVTCAGGYGWNPTNNTCEPCTGNEASINNSCEPCPDGTQPNADHTECVPCPDGTAGTNGTCEPCAPGYVPNAQATECVPCPAGTYWENGICEPCPEDYSSVPGSVGLDACFLAACPTGQHIAHGACEDDVIICDAPYAATATRTWNPRLGAYGSCQIQECEDGYHVASNACVPNDQLCNVANGRGERIWNGTQWGNCVVTECDPGFEPNASNTACGRCGNYMGADGQPAVSSYITGCEIATCMYQGQKYALENGECIPICETASDDTGSKHWDNTTKKCVRTCNPGYKMW